MNMHTNRHSLLIPTLLLAAASAPLSADTFTVRSTADPAVANAANCTAMTADCTLRDALAAADADADHDTIVFDVDDTIYLSRKLSAYTPVSIDGGGVTQLRVRQDYAIANLQDFRSSDILPTLQPVFENRARGARYMLELFASGSAVTNLHVDGSITPAHGETGVERVDFNADGVTDYALYPTDSDGTEVWPIAGGIRADFTATPPVPCDQEPPTGTVTMSGNLLTNFSGEGITVAFHQLADISDNEIRGGAGGAQGFNYDGIFMYCGAGARVTRNQVDGYRNGIVLVAAATVAVTDNELTNNVVGLNMDQWGALFGPNLVSGNESAHNLQFGMLMFLTSGTYVADNEVRDNGSGSFEEGGIILLGSSENRVEANEVAGNTGFGIVVDRSWSNEIVGNETKENGLGIVLVNTAYDNLVAENETTKNGTGILMTRTIPTEPFPFYNLVEANEAEGNLGVDLADDDPDCNDAWSGNAFENAYAASGACID